MASPQVKVTGLKELRRSLKAMSKDDTYKSELRATGLRAATVVATEARSLAARGATTKSGKHATMGHVAIASIKPGAGQGRATITGGRASLPYFRGWSEGGRAKQFPGPSEPDYVMWQAVKNKLDEAVDIYTDGIERLTGRHFR